MQTKKLAGGMQKKMVHTSTSTAASAFPTNAIARSQIHLSPPPQTRTHAHTHTHTHTHNSNSAPRSPDLVRLGDSVQMKKLAGDMQKKMVHTSILDAKVDRGTFVDKDRVCFVSVEFSFFYSAPSLLLRLSSLFRVHLLYAHTASESSGLH